MEYFSTRGAVKGLKFQDAVMMGMAEDGGLLLPSEYPLIDLSNARSMTYSELAFEIVKHFADDIPAEELKGLLDRSYQAFDTPEVAPVVKTSECYMAELFHGPTFAFKDVALQLLGNLFEYILTANGEVLNILGATSGDTGSAAIYGVRGKRNVRIVILYPEGRVSPVQELQMTSVSDSNVHTFAVKGTFDDCQNLVKSIFSDLEFKRRYSLGAVNSINWARIMAQIVYYFYAALRLPEGKNVNFVTPTGNFGNIFAGHCAKKMGLWIDKLVLASNENDILHRFVSVGDYSLKDVVPTHSPSMDIQISSNLERYLYYLLGTSGAVCDAMSALKTDGRIVFTPEEINRVQSDFLSYSVSNLATEEAVARLYKKNGYIVDPHTACGVEAAYRLNLNPENTIVLSTAHPAKFPDLIHKTLGFFPAEPAGIAKLHDIPVCVTHVQGDPDIVRNAIVTAING
ncbi:MAG: threonine synthase [Deferribacteraceae bacterium]|jgi:threonine synthase|nr:threonine synthase [Deferribacteraceae bacterium]